MKKMLSVFLVLTMMLSMVPFALASEETVEVPVPTDPTSTTATFEYTQGGEKVTEEVTVEISDPSAADTKDEVAVVETEVKETVTEKGKSDVTESHDTALVTEEEIVVQKTGTDEIVTVLDDAETAIEGGKDGCEHVWSAAERTKEPTCHSCGIDKYTCTCEGCGAVKYVEVAKTAHTKDDTTRITVDCVEKRYYLYKCTVTDCNEEFKVYDENIPAGSHNYVDGICTKCGDVDHTSGVIDNADTTKDPTYSFNDDTLVVAGEGEIPDYKVELTNVDGATVDVPATEATPWHEFADKIINIIIGSGITRIGDYAFSNLNNLQNVDIYGQNVSVGDYAFAEDEKLEEVNFMDKNAEVKYDNPVATVSIEENDVTYSDTGATAYAGDGTVDVNFSCVNPKADEQEKTQQFAFANVEHEDLHLNCSVIYGYAPTEKEFGLSDGLYCNDCKQIVKAQYKIYPNGKEETGKYKITDFSKLKEIPENLKTTKYNTLAKISELVDLFKEALAKAFREEYKAELLKDNYKIYNIELKELKTAVKPEKHIINIPYPTGTWPSANEYIVVQLTDDDKFEEVDTFMTNKGIQIEVETLNPVGVCWKAK